MRAKSVLLLSFLSISYFAQANNQDSIQLNTLKPYFNNIKIENNKVLIPEIKNYDVTLVGSDNQTVIDLKGNVHQPLVNKSVNLFFNIKDKSTQKVIELPAKNIAVTGKTKNVVGNNQPFVIPSLREWVGGKGNFKITTKSKIVFIDTSATSKQAAILLQEDLKKLLKLDLKIQASKKLSKAKGDINIAYSSDEALGKDGYHMQIGDVLNITAPKYAGKVFATRTILQLLEQNKSNLSIPQGETRDYPTYEVRGMMLDVARKFFTIDFLNDYVEFMSYYKMSNFQIHLNDNGFKQYFDNDWKKTYSGFRLESSTYPNLASKDGHYTKKEFIDLQKKAERYGITIIPEIDVPAHSLAFAHMMPELGSEKFGADHLDLNNPKTYEVVKNVFDEYTRGENPVFVGKEVHVGTDEYDKQESEKFRAFTDFVFKTVQDNGKTVRAWGALTHAKGNTPVRVKDVTLNMWYNGYADPIEMKKLGYPQISTPDGYLYIVPFAGYYYDYLNTNHLYSHWSPRQIGNVVFEKGDPIVRGGMFAVWNDVVGNGISEKDVHNRVFPAMQVLAQKMWTAEDGNPSLFDFNTQKDKIGEGPGLNIRGNFGQYKSGLIYHSVLDGSYSNLASTDIAQVKANGKTVNLPIEEIGENYTVSFWIKPSNGFGGSIFKSKNSVVSYSKEKGFTYERDGYVFDTDLILPLDKWSFVTVTGDKNGTQFYLNDKLIKDNKPENIVLATKDKGGKEVKFNKIKTLVFPLATISRDKAIISDLKVYNVKLNASEVSSEYVVNNK